MANHPGYEETKPDQGRVTLVSYGYDYAGFLRKIEAVFGDGILQVVWILTGKGEEDRLRQSLVKEFGTAQSQEDDGLNGKKGSLFFETLIISVR